MGDNYSYPTYNPTYIYPSTSKYYSIHMWLGCREFSDQGLGFGIWFGLGPSFDHFDGGFREHLGETQGLDN